MVGVSLHYHKIVQNEYYGYPEEWFPSVSATIGDRYPERSFFMLFIAITSGTDVRGIQTLRELGLTLSFIRSSIRIGRSLVPAHDSTEFYPAGICGVCGSLPNTHMWRVDICYIYG